MAAAASEALVAFSRFVNAVTAFASVERVGLSPDATPLGLWVIQGEENLEEAERIFLLEREFWQANLEIALTVHVVALSEIGEHTLPAMELVFDRARGRVVAQPG
jgi:hypothetical protein